VGTERDRGERETQGVKRREEGYSEKVGEWRGEKGRETQGETCGKANQRCREGQARWGQRDR
jgi:hypothetical protein